MFAKRFTLVTIILTCAFSAGGQQPEPGSVEKIVTTGPSTSLNQKVVFLATNIDIHGREIAELRDQIAKLRGQIGETARYQIAATTIRIEGGVYPQDFVQVFKMDTRTGYVCQVVGPKVVKGELSGTTLPYCTQQ